MSMNNKQICRFGNIILLTILLFAVVGCSSMSANNKSSGTVVSNVPVKMERSLQNFNGNTVSASKPAEDKLKEQTENKKEADKAIAKKPESATNETKVAKNGFGYRKGDIYLTKYLDVAAVNQLILVEQSETEASAGSLFLLAKNEKGEWVLKFYEDEEGTEKMFRREKKARMKYYECVTNNCEMPIGKFFEEEDE